MNRSFTAVQSPRHRPAHVSSSCPLRGRLTSNKHLESKQQMLLKSFPWNKPQWASWRPITQTRPTTPTGSDPSSSCQGDSTVPAGSFPVSAPRLALLECQRRPLPFLASRAVAVGWRRTHLVLCLGISSGLVSPVGDGIGVGLLAVTSQGSPWA